MDSLVISGLGALTPLGEDVATSVAAYKAGILPFAEHAYITCTPEEPGWDIRLPLFCTEIPFIDCELQSVERLFQVVIPAISQAIAQAGLLRSNLPRTGLFVALPVVDDSTSQLDLQGKFVPELLLRTGLKTLLLSKTFRRGHGAIHLGLIDAANKIADGTIDHALIVGVDSYLFESRIAHYDGQWRIKSERNVDGFIPGEAACALVLERQTQALAREVQALATYMGSGVAEEENKIGDSRSSAGAGLRSAIDQAFKQAFKGKVTPGQIGGVFSDFNGESYYAYELGLMHARYPDIFSKNSLVHPADGFGDTGSAAAAISIMLACDALANDERKGIKIILGSADDGLRAATLLKAV